MQNARFSFGLLRKFLYNSGMAQQREELNHDDSLMRLREGGLAYSIGAVLPLVLTLIFVLVAQIAAGESYQSTNWFKYFSYLLPQVGLAVTAIIWFRRTKSSPREAYRVCHPKYFALALVLSFGLFSLSWLNGYFVKLLELMGYRPSASTLPNVTGWYLLPAILVIAVLPAIFEETLFRVILVDGMRKRGWGSAALILISGALFSLFHGNPEQTIYQFICGACYALVAVRSESPLPTVAAHFANNAVILCLASAGYDDFPPAARLPVYIIAGVCLVGVLVYLIFFDRQNDVKGTVKDGKTFFFAAAVGIAVCAVQWLALFIGGFIGG